MLVPWEGYRYIHEEGENALVEGVNSCNTKVETWLIILTGSYWLCLLERSGVRGVPSPRSCDKNRQHCLPNCPTCRETGWEERYCVPANRKEGKSFCAANCFQGEYRKKSLGVETGLYREARMQGVDRCATKMREDEALTLVLEFTFIRRKIKGLVWMKAC